MSSPVAADVVVAKDGTGNFTTLTDAVKKIPAGTTRFTIYVKAGIYIEEGLVEITRANVTIVGDGMGKTVIQSSRSVSTGSNLHGTAALVAKGDNFIARDITFENTSGESAHQAVALQCSGDKSAFYLCSFLGFQDTLYVRRGKQFFRECVVAGTVDFIFGNAAVVFQNCTINLRQRPKGEEDVIAAHGRESLREETCITLQRCTIQGESGFDPKVTHGFLGRPWKQFATTMVMQCNIHGVIDAAGWMDWDNKLAGKDVTYREYDNEGEGPSTTGRIQKPSFKVVDNQAEAEKYTVAKLIDGEEWLPATNIPYYPGLNEKIPQFNV